MPATIATAIEPTPELYGELRQAFDHFNTALFGSELPECVLTLRQYAGAMAYFHGNRFLRRVGGQADEIALDSSYFAAETVEGILSSLAHEMVHQWQFHHGKPGRRGYHNREWARKMSAIGLVASVTGRPGGKQTGQRVSHYIVRGGPFDVACAALLARPFTLSWLDRIALRAHPTVVADAEAAEATEPPGPAPGPRDVAGAGGEAPPPAFPETLPETVKKILVVKGPRGQVNRTHRVKYACAQCGAQVWGKPGLRILCGAHSGAAREMRVPAGFVLPEGKEPTRAGDAPEGGA